jgi:plastocyanin
MNRTVLALLAALTLLVATATATATASTGGATKLVGTVGPGFTITLKDATGHKVKTLKAGKYAITVSDKSPIHNYRLKGPGLNKEITSVGFTGKKTVTVTLKSGKYTYVCDPHKALMHASFTVS